MPAEQTFADAPIGAPRASPGPAHRGLWRRAGCGGTGRAPHGAKTLQIVAPIPRNSSATPLKPTRGDLTAIVPLVGDRALLHSPMNAVVSAVTMPMLAGADEPKSRRPVDAQSVSGDSDRASLCDQLASGRPAPGTSSPAASSGVQSGVQFERNREQLRATRTRSRRLNPLRHNQNLPAGGRAVAGSNPVSPTQTLCK